MADTYSALLPLMNLKLFSLVALIHCTAFDSFAEDSPPAGIRMFTCAHSFHAFVYRQVAEAALDAGIKGHVSAGISSIGGSRVIQHWNLEDEKHQAKIEQRNQAEKRQIHQLGRFENLTGRVAAKEPDEDGSGGCPGGKCLENRDDFFHI